MSFSVVICAWSEARWPFLERCVESVLAQTVQPHEVIVVVDHNPALLGRVGETWPEVVAVENDGERGASSSRNTGARRGTGTHVAFLDDDAFAAPDWLERLGRAHEGAGALGVGGALEPVWLSGRPWWFPAEFGWVVGCTYPGLPTVRAPVRNAIAANMSIRRDVLARVGGERTGFGRIGSNPVACEETELCIRIRARYPDGEIVFDPEVRVSHHVTAERATFGYFARRCVAEGRSKARVARLAGPRVGLSAERRYVARTLPAGVGLSVVAAVREHDVRRLGPAAAIVLGLLLTTFGFVAERLRPRGAHAHAGSAPQPGPAA